MRVLELWRDRSSTDISRNAGIPRRGFRLSPALEDHRHHAEDESEAIFFHPVIFGLAGTFVRRYRRQPCPRRIVSGRGFDHDHRCCKIQVARQLSFLAEPPSVHAPTTPGAVRSCWRSSRGWIRNGGASARSSMSDEASVRAHHARGRTAICEGFCAREGARRSADVLRFTRSPRAPQPAGVEETVRAQADPSRRLTPAGCHVAAVHRRDAITPSVRRPALPVPSASV